MGEISRKNEDAFKIKELERLLSEGKITLEQYLDTRARIEKQATSSENLQLTEKTPVYDVKAQSSDVKEPKKPYTKMFLGLVLCIIILVGGFFAWSYLNPVSAESLTIEGYSVKVFTKAAILFELKNTGNTEVHISKVKMNGYLNQSVEGWNQGWNGTTILQPGQKDILYVYLFCYFHVLNASMPQLSSSPSQAEIENLYLWMESFNCTFTFVTDTQHQYNCTVPGLACMIIPAWMEASTYAFMDTEALQITNLTFLSNDRINITMRNTGTTTITIIEIWVNNVKTWSGNSVIDVNYQKTITLDVAWVTGNVYEVKVVSSRGNQFMYTAVAPSDGTQEESIQLFKLHTWHNGTSFAETAFLIINTGGRDIVIDKISVRGQECSWNTIYYNKTTDTINGDLGYVTPNANGTLTGKNATIGGTESDYVLVVASDDLILKSGWSMIVYITNPDHISVSDIGVTVGVTVFTANAQYYKEANVEAAQ